MQIKKLTIGIPTYNRPEQLGKTLESLLIQTSDNFTIVISNNCSLVDYEEVVNKYLLTKLEIKYIIQNNNIGPLNNYLYLANNCETEYFMWLADDDTIESVDYIEKLLSKVQDGYDFVFPNIKKFHTSGTQKINLPSRKVVYVNSIDKFELHFSLIKNSYLGYQLTSGIFRRETLVKYLPFLKYSQSYPNIPDEGPILHSLLANSNWSFVEDVFYEKDMTNSTDFKNSLTSAFYANLWHFFGVFGQIAMSKYTNWQKFKFGIVYFARCVFIWLSIGYYDIKKKLGFIKLQ